MLKTEIVSKESTIRSNFWKYFGLKKTYMYYIESLPTIGVLQNLSVFLPVEYGSQTTNMRAHLEKAHPDLIEGGKATQHKRQNRYP